MTAKRKICITVIIFLTLVMLICFWRRVQIKHFIDSKRIVGVWKNDDLGTITFTSDKRVFFNLDDNNSRGRFRICQCFGNSGIEIIKEIEGGALYYGWKYYWYLLDGDILVLTECKDSDCIESFYRVK